MPFANVRALMDLEAAKMAAEAATAAASAMQSHSSSELSEISTQESPAPSSAAATSRSPSGSNSNKAASGARITKRKPATASSSSAFKGRGKAAVFAAAGTKEVPLDKLSRAHQLQQAVARASSFEARTGRKSARLEMLAKSVQAYESARKNYLSTSYFEILRGASGENAPNGGAGGAGGEESVSGPAETDSAETPWPAVTSTPSRVSRVSPPAAASDCRRLFGRPAAAGMGGELARGVLEARAVASPLKKRKRASSPDRPIGLGEFGRSQSRRIAKRQKTCADARRFIRD